MFQTLVLSGGGTKGFYQLGCISPYESRGELKGIHTYIGTSVGAYICLLLISGYSVREIMNFALYVEFPSLTIDCVGNMLNSHGAYKVNPYTQHLETKIYEKWGYIPTLRQLYDHTEKRLITTGTSVNTGECIYFSYDTFPDMPCTRAVDISSRIPFLFTPIYHGGTLYVDGSLTNHFPIQKRVGPTLAICTGSKELGYIGPNYHIPHLDYIYAVINAVGKTTYTREEDVTLYVYKSKDISVIVDKESAVRMFLEGVLSRPSDHI